MSMYFYIAVILSIVQVQWKSNVSRKKYYSSEVQIVKKCIEEQYSSKLLLSPSG